MKKNGKSNNITGEIVDTFNSDGITTSNGVNRLAKNIRCFRSMYGLSQSKLAKQLGICRTSISSLENCINPHQEVPDGTLYRLYYLVSRLSEKECSLYKEGTLNDIQIQLLNEIKEDIVKELEPKEENFQKVNKTSNK